MNTLLMAESWRKSVVKPKKSDEEKQLIEFAFKKKNLDCLCSYMLRKINMVVNYQENQTKSCRRINSQMHFEWKTQVCNLEELHKCTTRQDLAQCLEADEITKLITQKISHGSGPHAIAFHCRMEVPLFLILPPPAIIRSKMSFSGF